MRLLRHLRAAAWSFFGIRRASGAQNDANDLSPALLILAGVALAAVFVLILVLVAHLASAASPA